MEDSNSNEADNDLNHSTDPKIYSGINKDIYLQLMKDKTQDMKNEILSNFQQNLNSTFEEFIKNIERTELNTSDGASSSSLNLRSRGGNGDKVFIPRNSVLSELLKISHIRTIYHIFVAILIVFMLNTLVCDFLDEGRLVLDFQLILNSFGKFPLVMATWSCMAISTSLVVYPLFQYWAENNTSISPNLQDLFWLLLYIVYQVIFLTLPLYTVIHNSIPSASAVIIVAEQVRLIMKAHSFIRENIPKVMQFRKSNDKKDELCKIPDFSKYLYFLFAPTLIYRDIYPRNSGPIRWNYVVSNFVQVLACLFYISYIFERFCIPVFRNFNHEYLSPKNFIITTFGSMLPGTLVLFIGFFAILHSWLNAFAEMLRFADRLFYKDWWNSTSFSNYYRTWNLVVHDWLYTYIYKDAHKLLGTKNRSFSMIIVFTLSAVVHEYILSVAFGFFYPVLLFMFSGIGFAFVFMPNKSSRSGNVFMWVSLFIGNGLLMCLYSMEWYARINCPITHNKVVDFFVPRSWMCQRNNTGS